MGSIINSHKRISLSVGQMTPQCLLLGKLTLRNCTCWRCHGKTVPPQWCQKAELLPPSLSSWHPLLVVKNEVWPPDIIWGDADFFYATVVIWIPFEVDICPLLKREDFSPWEPLPALGLVWVLPRNSSSLAGKHKHMGVGPAAHLLH